MSPPERVQRTTDVRIALEGDAESVVAIWREAATWLHEIGQPLWAPDSFTVPATCAMIARGEVVVGTVDGRPVACMQLVSSDPMFWPEESTGAALYVHKLAVVRYLASTGWAEALLDWAVQHAALAGIGAVRLDCAPRPKLAGIYQRCGFSAVDPEPVVRGGYRVWRFERRV